MSAVDLMYSVAAYCALTATATLTNTFKGTVSLVQYKVARKQKKQIYLLQNCEYIFVLRELIVSKLLLACLPLMFCGGGVPENGNVATLFVGVTYQGKGTRSSLGKRGLGEKIKKIRV